MDELKAIITRADTPDTILAIAAMIAAASEQEHPENADAIVAAFGNHPAEDYRAAVDLFSQAILAHADKLPADIVQTARDGISFINRRFLREGATV